MLSEFYPQAWKSSNVCMAFVLLHTSKPPVPSKSSPPKIHGVLGANPVGLQKMSRSARAGAH